jgi:lactoylglutathione lyase
MKFTWTTINVSNMEKSLAFYKDILGLELNRKMTPNPDMELAFLGTGDTQVELMYNRKVQDISFSKDISMGFETPSLDDFIQQAGEKGIQILSGPYQPNPHIRFLYIADPDGMKIQILENITP